MSSSGTSRRCTSFASGHRLLPPAPRAVPRAGLRALYDSGSLAATMRSPLTLGPSRDAVPGRVVTEPLPFDDSQFG